jgi:hypothetical protein
MASLARATHSALMDGLVSQAAGGEALGGTRWLLRGGQRGFQRKGLGSPALLALTPSTVSRRTQGYDAPGRLIASALWVSPALIQRLGDT